LRREDALPAIGQKLFQVNEYLSFSRLDFLPAGRQVLLLFLSRKKVRRENCIKAKEQNN
jgi:hypothetical protein